MVNVTLIPLYEDNYSYLVQSDKTVAVVDVGDAAPVIDYLEKHDITPDLLLTTHHHWDHIDGIVDFKKKYDVLHIAAEKDKHRIPQIDRTVQEGDTIAFNDEEIGVIETHGHTLNHINFYFKKSHVLFSGDTLFAMGCGRLLEGTAEQMFASFQKLKSLPDDTKIYCGHEYTLSNGEFCLSVDPDNTNLIDRMADVRKKRQKNQPTIPSTIGIEKQTNIFMKAQTAEEFKNYRDLKDQF